MTDQKKKLAVVGVLLIALTWWLATDPSSPIRPQPQRPDRPVLKFIAKAAGVAARLGLTFLMFAEPAPDSDELQDPQPVLGADGYQQLANSRW